ncbi:DUF4304 domain-containing protein [Chryseobacterium sp. G0201]|uniref:DUF4304 domain-containing protein n=1 Tax=Chryseobacterium sp. G0201 TaxID=2487065 RepID=UPI000F50DAE8|nr:DUF4304 domain-containing protein [Chryseobacterium sp. G0201]AZA54142.1 DUF4304 domain-containing protein [Chryseobacterium sp. G0201]
METRTIFLNACHEIANQLDGFKTLEKGQRLKKISIDKDIYFEIYFQSSFRNDSSFIQILPHINIYSKILKKWQIEQTKNEYSQGLIFGNQIGYFTPYNNWKEWNLAGLSYDNSITEITESIKQHILPIFEFFNSKEIAIDFLKNNGTKFNQWAEDSISPLNFLLCFSEKETAEIFFNNFISHCPYKGNIFNLYEKLKTMNEIDLNHSEFHGADTIKLAYVKGLKIK